MNRNHGNVTAMTIHCTMSSRSTCDVEIPAVAQPDDQRERKQRTAASSASFLLLWRSMPNISATKKNALNASRVSGARYTTYTMTATAATNCHAVRLGSGKRRLRPVRISTREREYQCDDQNARLRPASRDRSCPASREPPARRRRARKTRWRTGTCAAAGVAWTDRPPEGARGGAARRPFSRALSRRSVASRSAHASCALRAASRSRSTLRCTLPVVVIGSASMNSISFGYS